MATIQMLKSVTDTINTSFIIKNGSSTIAFDGGFESEEEYLHKKVLEAGGVVDAWFLTHAHDDHIIAFYTMLDKYNDIKVKKVYYNFPSDEYLEKYEPVLAGMKTVDMIGYLTSACEKHGCEIIISQKGDKYDFDGFCVKVLYTPDESITVNAINNTSTIFRVEIEESKKSILFLGDLGVEGGQQFLATVPPELIKADYVQMAHHGQNGVGREVYEAIMPSACFWCTPTWLWDNMGENGYDTGRFKTVIVRGWMSELGCVKHHYIMTNGTQTITI